MTFKPSNGQIIDKVKKIPQYRRNENGEDLQVFSQKDFLLNYFFADRTEEKEIKMAKIKINSKQLPVKAHFFFFMSAMGPILPFMTVYGKQIGVSPMVMGVVTAILPVLFFISKPAFGFLVDYFRSVRKLLFVALLIFTALAFVSIYFLPVRKNFSFDGKEINVTLSCDELRTCESRNITRRLDECQDDSTLARCRWSCLENMTNHSTNVIFTKRDKNYSAESICIVNDPSENFSCRATNEMTNCGLSCNPSMDDGCLYSSLTFWGFVILISLGSIGFNVSNSISDAICFDVLGDGGQMGYGRQRVWGTIGFGVAALLGGYTVDWWSEGQVIKNYTPAFILILIFTSFDVLCCTKLELPIMSGSENIAKDVYGILKMKPILIFLCFAVMAGIFDSFIIYFMFWYLEDLAMTTGHFGQITLIEGLIVAAETLGSEIIFFSFSGKILKRFGYGYSFVFCLACYSLRLGLISFAPNPWWVIPIEFFMQGPTYALCYTTIVAFASVVAPPGTSATVQGIVAGMDDGLGYSIGSLIGGFLYKKLGGVLTLRIFSSLASVSSCVYLLLHLTYMQNAMPQMKSPSKKNRSINVEWKSPEEATRECHTDDEK